MVNYSRPTLDRTFAALADPTRRAILARLAQGEASAGELARPFDVSLPAISRHLKVLEGAGLLRRRKAGRVHRCKMNPRPLVAAGRWIAEHRRFWEESLSRLETYLDHFATPETTNGQHRHASRAAHPRAPHDRRRS